MELDYKYLCIVGDIHGEFRKLVWTIYTKKLKDTAFIVAGDFGLGFHKFGYYEREYIKISRRLDSLGSCLLGIRGNHDNPSFFNPESENFIDFPRFKALPDYSRLSWGSREVVVIGGATSKDISDRLEHMKKRPKQICWWKDERPVRDISMLKPKEDIIISHEAPLCIGPVPYRTGDLSLEDYHCILEDREYLSEVLKETRPTRYYFGHYHRPTSGSWNDTVWKGLEKHEIIEVRQ